MREHGDGAITIINSIGGLRGRATIGAYNVSKPADFQLLHKCAVENGQHKNRVNAIAAGLVQSDFARALWDKPETLKRVETRILSRLIGQPDDSAGAAVHLASPAPSWTIGQIVVADGRTTI